MERMTTALMSLDESSGIVGDDVCEIMSLYRRASVAAPPKPNELVVGRTPALGRGCQPIEARRSVDAKIEPSTQLRVTNSPAVTSWARKIGRRSRSAGSWSKNVAKAQLVKGEVGYFAIFADNLTSPREVA